MYPVKELARESNRLRNYLWSRQIPPENRLIGRKAEELERKVIERLAPANDGTLDDSEAEKV